ncbi:hypothetical protein QCA50_003331 [Cerrena zonata]|uniref:DUF6534 domain-containing protein n=1 Tax=Cerrena zonata TaxID=2478898 RepID=A0AAW0GW25_9APHY
MSVLFSPSLLDLNNSLGIIYISIILIAFLCGITNLQAYIYFVRNPGDSLALKTTIAVLLYVYFYNEVKHRSLELVFRLLDNLQLPLVTYAYYNLTITNFGSLLVLVQPQWGIIGYVGISVTVDVLVRGVYIYRVWVLSMRKKILSATLAVMSIATFGCGIMFAVEFGKSKGLSDISSLSWPIYLGLGTIAVCDVSIAAVLCVLLKRQATLSKHTYSIFRSLILYGINASALTSICAVISLILYATVTTSLVCIAFYCMLPKLYSISLLALLNSRKSLRERKKEAEVIVISQTSNSSSYNRKQMSADHNLIQDTSMTTLPY